MTERVVSSAIAVIQIGRKGLLELGQHVPGACDRLQGVRAGELVEREDPRRFAVETALNVVVLGAQFEARHILQPDERAAGICAQHDLAELLGGGKPPLGPDGVGELLAGRDGLAADLTGRVHRVLLLEGVGDLGDGDVELGEQIRAHPAAHGILAGAEDRDTGDPPHPGELVDDIDIGIIGQEGGVVGPLGRIEGDEHQGSGERLLDGYPEVPHIDRELPFRLGLAQMGEHLVGVRVGFYVEVHGQPHRARCWD